MTVFIELHQAGLIALLKLFGGDVALQNVLPVERAVPYLVTVTCACALTAVMPATNPVSAARILTNFTAKLPKRLEPRTSRLTYKIG